MNSSNKEIINNQIFVTNNIAESLHNKINLYLPNKKITNTNFIYAIRNIFINYELKKETIRRKDYITRSLIKIANQIDYNNYIWIDFKNFKYEESVIIKESKLNEKDNINNDLLDSIKNLNLNDDLDINLNEESRDKYEGQNISEIFDNDSEKSISSEDEDIDFDNIDEFKLTSLYDRMLADKRFLDGKDMILNIKNKPKKRLKCSGESGDEEIINKNIKNEIKKKIKIRYPKKK